MSESIQLIEREYINSLLDVDQVDDSPVIVQHESIDHSEVFKQPEIACQIFNIAGMNIAVPVSSIREIIEQAVPINTENNSSPSMLAGTISHKSEAIELIDIEYLIMNKNSAHGQIANGVVLLKGSSTGFIYEEPPAGQSILSQDVHWRDANSQRLWLAGTVAQLGMALLDIDGLLKLLQAQN